MEGERTSSAQISSEAAKEAVALGYQSIPIRTGSKSPAISAWTQVEWNSEEEAGEAFDRWTREGATGIGLLLGKPSGGLIDVDLDHPKALRMRNYFLPPTAMMSGRPGRPQSHFWYRATGENLPGTRPYKMPDGKVSVELRSTGAQTVIPPSIHPSGEQYRWEGEPWGGDDGPLEVDGRTLALQVGLLGLGAVLLDNWPAGGSRHEAYLALAGMLLRKDRNGGVHPWWEKNLPVLIRGIAQATNDKDGPEARIREVMGTTVTRLLEGGKAVGFPTLSGLIGVTHAEQARRMITEVESLAGVFGEGIRERESLLIELAEQELIAKSMPLEERDPLAERGGYTWKPVDMEPYIFGEARVPQPSVLKRSDGQGLFYDGRVNSLYGQSEAAKSWIALVACMQEMTKGERVLYLDFEDEPTFTLDRLRHIGVGDDDIRNQFIYVRPEDPISHMQRNRWGTAMETTTGQMNAKLFGDMLEERDPRLIIVDGMMVLYGLHGLDSNDGASTDVITSWLKKLCRDGKSTVIVIDHTGKSAGKGASPIGAHHKIAMVQGTALQAHPINQPMKGELGEVQLLVFKDRPGAVRAESGKTTKPQLAATVYLDSRVEGKVKVTIEPPDANKVTIGDGDDPDALRRAGEKVTKKAQQQEALEAILDVFGGDTTLRLSLTEIDARVNYNFKPQMLSKRIREFLLPSGQLVKYGRTGSNVTYGLR